MGDKMRPISFNKMITWIIKELEEKESILEFIRINSIEIIIVNI